MKTNLNVGGAIPQTGIHDGIKRRKQNEPCEPVPHTPMTVPPHHSGPNSWTQVNPSFLSLFFSQLFCRGNEKVMDTDSVGCILGRRCLQGWGLAFADYQRRIAGETLARSVNI